MPLPLTLDDWHAAWLGGASPRELLGTFRARLLADADTPAGRPCWITLASESQFADRLDALDALVRTAPDRAALLARYPLFGVPFAVKDNIDVAGVPTSAACPAWARADGQPPAQTATAVQRLLDAGAVWVGKTNLDQFATGLVGTRSPYGRPASAFDAQHISGGSSSGSAVSVARGWACFALGTDTAGSGRVPAGFNHLVGLKPTPGRVSTAGVLPACRTLDCVSVFALTVDDAARVLAVMEGPDPADPYAAAADSPVRLGPPPSTGPWRLGVPRALLGLLDGGDAAEEGLSPTYAAGFRRALAHAASLGHVLVPIDATPLHDVAALLYTGPWVAERHAVVADLMDRQPEALDPVVRTVIDGARRYTATDTFRAQYRLRELAAQANRLWQDVDALLVPTAPLHPLFAQIDADPIGINARLGRYTNFVNLLGWCALALPFERTPDGLPFGVTVIAPGGHDARLAGLGQAWQRSRPDEPLGATGRLTCTALGDVPPPGPTPTTEPGMPLVVVGAHLSGMPLNGQLTERGALRLEATTTAPRYRLYALPGTTPPKPGLKRVGPRDAAGGAAIAVEVWWVPQRHVGSFLALIPPPLGLGSVELADGRWVHGFICEGHALDGATDVTAYGGWRAYMAAVKAGEAAAPATGAAANDNLPVNLPEVQAEVTDVFHRYEAALAAHDVPAMAAMFWDADAVVRYGIADMQHGPAEIAAFRNRGLAIGPNRRLERTVVTTFGTCVATVMTQFRDDGDPRLGRQSQTWVRWPDGWKVVAAHVSRVPVDPAG